MKSFGNKLKIGLDYDECFTEDEEFWAIFVSMAKRKGHEVKFVTYRPNLKGSYNDDIEADAAWLDIEIIYTSGKQKANFYKADIWIDDSPETIPSAKVLGDAYDSCLMINDMEEK